MFFKKIDQIKVSEDAVEEVILDRIVSGIDLVVEDSIPSVVSSISIITKNEGSVQMVHDGISMGSVPTRTATFTIGNRDRRILNKTFSTYALPNDGIPGTAVEIKAFDASAKELVSKEVKVDYIRNKKITIKGKLFTGLSTGNSNPNFLIKVNETWDKGGVEIKLP
ncbi:hypothetical protein [Desertivirga brevis]|uniref:hypothetical protein n=1 Tax=Desertivirga brevis TaxID=2810310 RepID=UPI001A959794|nr:hypothetical protein [Pedobacter sp. SYSU D00873]